MNAKNIQSFCDMQFSSQHDKFNLLGALHLISFLFFERKGEFLHTFSIYSHRQAGFSGVEGKRLKSVIR